MSARNIHNNVTYYDMLVAFERQNKLKGEWQQFGLPLQNLLAFLLAIGLGNFEGFGELWVLYCVMIIPFQLSMTTTLFYPHKILMILIIIIIAAAVAIPSIIHSSIVIISLTGLYRLVSLCTGSLNNTTIALHSLNNFQKINYYV